MMIGKIITIQPNERKRITKKDEYEPICEVKIKDELYKAVIIEMSSSGRYKLEILEKI